MRLRNLELGDLALYEAVHCDPRMMEHLGGPLPTDGLAEKLARDVATTAAGETWVLVIIPEDDRPDVAAGTIAVWDHEWEGRTITEIGWIVLPDFQGCGLGGAAVRATLDRARREERWSVIHAFPPLSNAPSNAMCRKMGFRLVEEVDVRFRDRPLRGNHWQLDLRDRPPG